MNVKPIAGTDSCQFTHTGYVVSGRMVIRMDDGSEYELKAATRSTSPGHDAWISGDEACVMIDVGGADGCAKPAPRGSRVPAATVSWPGAAPVRRPSAYVP